MLMVRLMRCGLLLSWLLLSVPGSALAQAPSAPHATDATDERAQSFEAVSGAVKEDIAGGPLMLAAYAFVWLAVFGYGFRLVRLHRSIEAELARVERAVEVAAKSGARG
jgi:CcmD family protein